MRSDARVFVTGHRGLVGSALVRRLRRDGFEPLVRSRSELDLRDRGAVDAFFAAERPEYVFAAAAVVGGIAAHAARPAEFLHDNLAIQLNVIDGARRFGARKLLFVGSAAVYPREAPQPLREEQMLTGGLEPTLEPYAVAKIAGVKLVEASNRQYGSDFVSVLPPNIYGPGDRIDSAHGHVLGSLLHRFHEAQRSGSPEVVVWGTGGARREFLYADDLADACVHVMRHYGGDAPLNVGAGEDVTIAELAELIRGVVGYRGAIRYDAQRPEGSPRRLLDVSRLRALGWVASVPLREGVARTYEWYLRRGAGEAGAAVV